MGFFSKNADRAAANERVDAGREAMDREARRMNRAKVTEPTAEFLRLNGQVATDLKRASWWK